MRKMKIMFMLFLMSTLFILAEKEVYAVGHLDRIPFQDSYVNLNHDMYNEFFYFYDDETFSYTRDELDVTGRDSIEMRVIVSNEEDNNLVEAEGVTLELQEHHVMTNTLILAKISAYNDFQEHANLLKVKADKPFQFALNEVSVYQADTFERINTIYLPKNDWHQLMLGYDELDGRIPAGKKICVIIKADIIFEKEAVTNIVEFDELEKVDEIEEEKYLSLSREYEGDFLAAKAKKKFHKNFLDITQLKSFYLVTKISNKSKDNNIAANNVNVRLKLPNKYEKASKESIITSVISCDNSNEREYESSFTITSKRNFKLVYGNEAYVYRTDDKKILLKGKNKDIVHEKGLCVGYDDCTIPLGKEVYVFVKINIKFIDEIDVKKLSKKQKATMKCWNLIQKYADPQYFRKIYRYTYEIDQKAIGQTTKVQKAKLNKVAKNLTKKCKTDYDKMKKVANYISNRIYYDFDYLENRNLGVEVRPYQVYTGKKSVCQGYANLYWLMMDELGIPCMNVYSDDHVYNAVYDKDSKRWVFLDATWNSNNRYENRTYDKNKAKDIYFDISPEQLLEMDSHEIFTVEGLLKDNAYYSCKVRTSEWSNRYLNMKNWRIIRLGKKDNRKKVKFSKTIEGIQVR